MSRTKLFQLVISGNFSAPVFYDRVINFLDSMREIYCLAIYVYPLCTCTVMHTIRKIFRCTPIKFAFPEKPDLFCKLKFEWKETAISVMVERIDRGGN